MQDQGYTTVSPSSTCAGLRCPGSAAGLAGGPPWFPL